MKTISFILIAVVMAGTLSFTSENQEFQGQAFYFSKSKMELGNWGATMSEAQKKQVYSRLKNRLEKTYVLSFNKEESVFQEEDQVDATAGATDTWGANFSRGDQYKDVKRNVLIQSQEFYGKKFLVKDNLQPIEWKMAGTSKQIGQYTCFKATASVPTGELGWYDFSWSDLRGSSDNGKSDTEAGEKDIPMTEIVAWYSLQIPVSHGPGEYWGLPGLILEVSAGETTMLCSKIVMNPEEVITIKAPNKGKEITKKEYQSTVLEKMQEMMNNRGRRRRN